MSESTVFPRLVRHSRVNLQISVSNPTLIFILLLSTAMTTLHSPYICICKDSFMQASLELEHRTACHKDSHMEGDDWNLVVGGEEIMFSGQVRVLSALGEGFHLLFLKIRLFVSHTSILIDIMCLYAIVCTCECSRGCQFLLRHILEY